jgi:hypothetical protein
MYDLPAATAWATLQFYRRAVPSSRRQQHSPTSSLRTWEHPCASPMCSSSDTPARGESKLPVILTLTRRDVPSWKLGGDCDPQDRFVKYVAALEGVVPFSGFTLPDGPGGNLCPREFENRGFILNSPNRGLTPLRDAPSTRPVSCRPAIVSIRLTDPIHRAAATWAATEHVIFAKAFLPR